MNRFTVWCFRVGLCCGVFALISALAIAAHELGLRPPLALRSFAERSFVFFGLAFMWLGIILLVAAIVRLRNSWSQLSKSVKVVSVLGLGASTFLGAYVFHWLLPTTPNKQAH
jgi:hypothetical protein